MNIFINLLTFLVIVSFTACGNDGSDETTDNTYTPATYEDLDNDVNDTSNNGNTVDVILTSQIDTPNTIDPKFYGGWTYTHNGQEIYITSETSLVLEEIADSGLLTVTNDGIKYHLMRSSVAKVNLSGRIEAASLAVKSSPLKKASGHAGIARFDVIIENVLDSSIRAEITTDENGTFSDTSLPAGTYNMTAIDGDNELKATVNIERKEENLGTFKITDDASYNFKAELILDKEFIYADTSSYTGKIRIHNLSEIRGTGLYYTISLTDDNLISFQNDNAKGTLDPLTYQDINVSFSFNPLFENEKSINIDVEIGDVYLNTWNDSFNFTVYKSPIDINMLSESSNVKGYLIMPNTNKIKQIDMKNGTLQVPTLSNKTYDLVISNMTLDEETSYSIAINKDANSSFNTFNYTPAHEPNNNEDEATELYTNDSVVSYIHIEDVDYWKIITPEDQLTLVDTRDTSSYFQFDTISNAVASNYYESNEALISMNSTEKSSISVNSGSIVLNGIDTLSSTTEVTNNDTIKIRTLAPENYYDIKTIELYHSSGKRIFTVNAPEVSIQEEGTLMWEDSSITITQKLSWDDASSYCETLDYAGFTDWKLPTVNNIKSFHKYKEEVKHFKYARYWTSLYSTFLSMPYYAYNWSTSIDSGTNDGVSNRSTLYNVRCIRNLNNVN